MLGAPPSPRLILRTAIPPITRAMISSTNPISETLKPMPIQLTSESSSPSLCAIH
jgi:hypothetical protein